jgi:hypothetical protein
MKLHAGEKPFWFLHIIVVESSFWFVWDAWNNYFFFIYFFLNLEHQLDSFTEKQKKTSWWIIILFYVTRRLTQASSWFASTTVPKSCHRATRHESSTCQRNLFDFRPENKTKKQKKNKKFNSRDEKLVLNFFTFYFYSKLFDFLSRCWR